MSNLLNNFHNSFVIFRVVCKSQKIIPPTQEQFSAPENDFIVFSLSEFQYHRQCQRMNKYDFSCQKLSKDYEIKKMGMNKNQLAIHKH